MRAVAYGEALSRLSAELVGALGAETVPDAVPGDGTLHRRLQAQGASLVRLDVLDAFDATVVLPVHLQRAPVPGFLVFYGALSAPAEVVEAAIYCAMRARPSAELHVLP
jgi:hypothetical protein